MVFMDRQDYICKANTLLNQNTYRSIPQDPTNTIKNKLINILKRVKSQTGLSKKLTNICTLQVVSPQVVCPSSDPQAGHSS